MRNIAEIEKFGLQTPSVLTSLGRERRFTPPHRIQSSITYYTRMLNAVCVFSLKNRPAPRRCASVLLRRRRRLVGRSVREYQSDAPVEAAA
jgi:hypothetical protein